MWNPETKKNVFFQNYSLRLCTQCILCIQYKWQHFSVCVQKVSMQGGVSQIFE